MTLAIINKNSLQVDFHIDRVTNDGDSSYNQLQWKTFKNFNKTVIKNASVLSDEKVAI